MAGGEKKRWRKKRRRSQRGEEEMADGGDEDETDRSTNQPFDEVMESHQSISGRSKSHV